MSLRNQPNKTVRALPVPPTITKTYKSINRKILNWQNDHSFLFRDNARWYAGITNDPDRRKREHVQRNGAECRHWMCWDAKSYRIARALENSLAKRGFCHDPVNGGSNSNSRYVYVFKKFPVWG